MKIFKQLPLAYQVGKKQSRVTPFSFIFGNLRETQRLEVGPNVKLCDADKKLLQEASALVMVSVNFPLGPP